MIGSCPATFGSGHTQATVRFLDGAAPFGARGLVTGIVSPSPRTAKAVQNPNLRPTPM